MSADTAMLGGALRAYQVAVEGSPQKADALLVLQRALVDAAPAILIEIEILREQSKSANKLLGETITWLSCLDTARRESPGRFGDDDRLMWRISEWTGRRGIHVLECRIPA